MATAEVKCMCEDDEVKCIAAAISDQLKCKTRVNPNHMIEVIDVNVDELKDLCKRLHLLNRYVYLVVDCRSAKDKV